MNGRGIVITIESRITALPGMNPLSLRSGGLLRFDHRHQYYSQELWKRYGIAVWSSFRDRSSSLR